MALRVCSKVPGLLSVRRVALSFTNRLLGTHSFYNMNDGFMNNTLHSSTTCKSTLATPKRPLSCSALVSTAENSSHQSGGSSGGGKDDRMSGYWDYSNDFGPSYWPAIWPTGESQSPVDIQTHRTAYNDTLVESSLVIHDDVVEWKAANSGCGVHFEPNAKSHRLAISGGPLASSYALQQFHFHWGTSNFVGSEHKVDGKSYAAELHLVHWNKSFGSFENAVDKPNGLAVIGVFLTPDDVSNPNLDVFLSHLSEISYKGMETKIRTQSSPYIMLPKNKDAYWTYPGSLTTPPLYESVTWIVCPQAIPVSNEQLEAFRSLKAIGKDQLPFDNQAHPMGSGGCLQGSTPCIAGNFRPTQPLNKRQVEASFPSLLGL